MLFTALFARILHVFVVVVLKLKRKDCVMQNSRRRNFGTRWSSQNKITVMVSRVMPMSNLASTSVLIWFGLQE